MSIRCSYRHVGVPINHGYRYLGDVGQRKEVLSQIYQTGGTGMERIHTSLQLTYPVILSRL